MKIKNIKISERLKKIACVLGCTFVLAGTLTGCGKRGYEFSSDLGSSFGATDITDEELESLSSDIECLDLNFCNFITDLSSIPTLYPNLRRVTLKKCSSITDLNFLYFLPNLEYVELNDMAGVTPKLLEFLSNKGVEVVVEDRDILAYEKAQEILDEIITDDMTDEEKIKAIALYVFENCSYKISSVSSSNNDPLETTLLDGKGVCAGYAYTTNVLLRMAGIESFELTDTDHGWNLVHLGDKYYYLDVTNLRGCCMTKTVPKYLLKYLDISMGNYLSDPTATAFTVMSDYDDKSVIIPEELVEDILKGEDEKTLYEKYKNSMSLGIIKYIMTFIGIIVGIKMFAKAKEKIEDLSYSR